jgi:hypothetical protein
METISFLHNGTIGDTFASLPAIREAYRKTGKKAILYLVNGQKAEYYEGATHPTRDEKGTMVMLNKEMIDKMIPLFNAQECIEDTRIWDNEKINWDLNAIRDTFVNMPNGCISQWYFIVYPDLACDLSEQWLSVPDTDKDFAKGKIIISRTERYLNPAIDYRFLKDYENDILFSGTELEYTIFNIRFGLKVKRLEITNFLELAQAIKQSKFHISNQTMAFQLSQGLKHPRIVELCSFAPNVMPIGKKAYGFYAQAALEYYFHELNDTLEVFKEKYGNEKKAATGSL